MWPSRIEFETLRTSCRLPTVFCKNGTLCFSKAPCCRHAKTMFHKTEFWSARKGKCNSGSSILQLYDLWFNWFNDALWTCWVAIHLWTKTLCLRNLAMNLQTGTSLSLSWIWSARKCKNQGRPVFAAMKSDQALDITWSIPSAVGTFRTFPFTPSMLFILIDTNSILRSSRSESCSGDAHNMAKDGQPSFLLTVTCQTLCFETLSIAFLGSNRSSSGNFDGWKSRWQEVLEVLETCKHLGCCLLLHFSFEIFCIGFLAIVLLCIYLQQQRNQQ